MMGARMTRLSVVAAVVVALVVVGGSGVSFGAPLGLTQTFPDIDSFFIQVDYTPGSPGSFTASGTPASFTLVSGGTHHNISLGTYNIAASVDTSGNASGGSLTIGGTIPDLVLPDSGTLLTGTLDQFGYHDPADGIFEFVFTVTGGDLTPYYGGEAGVILTAVDSGFDGTFTHGFSNSDLGWLDSTADTFAQGAVPEPASVVLMLLGLAAVGFRSRR